MIRRREKPHESEFSFFCVPYMALSLLAVGLAVRYLLERKRMDAVRTEMAEAWSVFGGANVWRAGVALLLRGACGGSASSAVCARMEQPSVAALPVRSYRAHCRAGGARRLGEADLATGFPRQSIGHH